MSDANLTPEIPGYQLIRPIAEGSYGEVWLGQSEEGLLRAIKIVRRDRFEHARPYERETRSLARFTPISRGHHGVVDVFETGRDPDDRFVYCLMELADDATGQDWAGTDSRPLTLQGYLSDLGKGMPLEECLNLALKLARALGYLHAHGLVHRDVKPSNIVIIEGQPRLADIGLLSTESTSNSIVGTYGYIPVEGPGKKPADVFALGKVIYEMATGKDRHDFPEIDAPGPELLDLNQIILKACADHPGDRYADGNALAADLERVRDGLPPLAGETPRTHWPWLATAAAATLMFWIFRAVSSDGLPVPAVSPEPAGWRQGIAAHWKLDGNAQDTSGNGHHGTAHGLKPARDRFGKEGAAAAFDGNAYINFGDAFDMGRESLSLTLWIKTQDERFGLINKALDGPAHSRWAVEVNYVHDARRYLLITGFSDVGGRSGVLALSDPKTTGLNDGQWHQLAVVFDRQGSLTTYLDGVPQTTAALKSKQHADLQSSYPLLLGVPGNEQGDGPSTQKSRWLEGILDDVRLWRRALTSDEIRQHYLDEAPAPNSDQPAWDFEHHYSHVFEPAAMRYLAETNNVKRFIEWQSPPLVYWGTISNNLIGSIIYHFPLPKPAAQTHLLCSVSTWDFTNSNAGIGRGAAAIEASTNRIDWVSLFQGLEPAPLWETDAHYNRPLPPELLGATNYFIRIRLLKEDATEPEYATAQHARMKRLPGNKAFEFKARFQSD